MRFGSSREYCPQIPEYAFIRADRAKVNMKRKLKALLLVIVQNR